MRDERSDAGARLVNDAGHGHDAERGGDRRGRERERVGDTGAVEPHLQHLDGRLDVEPSFRVGMQRSRRVAAAAARAAVRSRRAQIDISSVARGDGVHALGSGAAAEVEALRGEVPVELVQGRQRGDRQVRQLLREHNASRVKLGHLGLARKELIEGGERVERAGEALDEDIRSLRRVAPRETSVEVLQHIGERCDARAELDRQSVLLERRTHEQRQLLVRGREGRKRAGGRPDGERGGDEHRTTRWVRAHALAQHRPEEEDDVSVRPEHATLRQRRDLDARLPRVGPVRAARGVVVAFERHERVRGDLERGGQRARRAELRSQRQHALQERSLICRRPVEPAVGHGPLLEGGERGRRQAGREVDLEAVVVDPAESPEQVHDDVER